jgi:PAS domain S-box-containing protein
MELRRSSMPASPAVSDFDLDSIRHRSDVPPLLATIPPSIGQRRVVRILILALLASVLVTWPFASVKLPAIPAFVPIIAAALFISYGVTAILLFGQFSILRHRALLVIACGYLFSGLMAVAHSLAFPGAFSPTGLNGAGSQSAVLLYDIWHVGLPFAAIGYAVLKDADRTVSTASTRLTISSSVVAMVVLAGAIFWSLTRYNDLLPVSYVDLQPLSLFRRMIGGVADTAISGTALCVIWVRRRTLFDEWLMVALCAIVVELILAALLPGERYNVAWYAARLYQAVTATVVMIVLLAETIRLYATSLENTRLYRDLEDRESKIRRLVDANIIGIFVADAEGRILEANDAFLRMLGYDRDDWGHVRRTDLTPPEWRERDLRTQAELNSTGIVQPFEKEYFRKDGSRVPVLVGAARFKEGGNQGVAFVLDLTERKRMEEALRESERTLRSTIDGIPGQVGILAPNGELEAVSSQILEYSGRSLEELKDWARNGTIHPDDLGRFTGLFTKSIAAGVPFETEARLRRSDGEYRWFDLRVVPSRDDSGRITRWYYLHTEIEDRTRALARLQQLQSDFAHMNRVSTMGELGASLAHEILHPIATARNNARVGTRFLEMSPPNLDEVGAALDRVVRDVDRAKDIVGRMRDQIKKAPARRDRFDLNTAINEIIVLARSAIVGNGVSLHTRLTDGQFPVLGDRVQLQQVVLNLVLNAAEAMGSNQTGARELLIRTEQGQTGVLVAVSDSGPGINPELLDRVFEPFYTTKASGIGMGLSICRSIIEAHGGRLWAEANEPRGAVFQFTLPGA